MMIWPKLTYRKSHWLRLIALAWSPACLFAPTVALAQVDEITASPAESPATDATSIPESSVSQLTEADTAIPMIDDGLGQPELPELPGLPLGGAGLGTGLTASLGVTHGSYSTAPAMVGDFFGGSFVLKDGSSGQPNQSIPGEGGSPPTVALAGGDRRFKIAENVSPIPRDRVFFNFNHFENALTDFRGQAVSLGRYAGGFEKTFLNELASIEMRLPIADGLNSTQRLNGTETEGVELSNLSIALKAIMSTGEHWAITGGTTITVPIADDYVETIFDNESLRVRNEAVHLAPFIGWLIVDDGDWFAQGFVQADFDLNGNEVVRDGDDELGRLQDQSLLFVDASVGRWLMRDAASHRWINGVAWMTELHYTTTLNDTDQVGGLTNPFGHMDILNLTAALHFQSGLTSIRIGGAAPIRDEEESLFDAEVMVQLTRQF